MLLQERDYVRIVVLLGQRIRADENLVGVLWIAVAGKGIRQLGLGEFFGAKEVLYRSFLHRRGRTFRHSRQRAERTRLVFWGGRESLCRV